MSDRIIICRASAGDLHEIAKAEEEIFSDPWGLKGLTSSFESENYVFFVAKDENDVFMGYVIGISACGEAELLRIAVSPCARGQGVGKKLLAHYIDSEKEKNSLKLFLEVRDSNVPAITLYSSYGFTKYATRNNYYKNPTENAVMMCLDLGD